MKMFGRMHTFHVQTTDVCLKFQMTFRVCVIAVTNRKADTMVGSLFCVSCGSGLPPVVIPVFDLFVFVQEEGLHTNSYMN